MGGQFNDVRSLVDSLGSMLNLFKLDVQNFDGSPEDYFEFMNEFKLQRASKLQDDCQKLSYLLRYCKGASKETINHCSLLSATYSYEEALRLLKNSFGQPHQIIEAVTKGIFNVDVIRPGNGNLLKLLLRRMRRFAIVLGQLNPCSDLDSTYNLTRVVHSLTNLIPIKLAKHVENLLDLDLQPTFEAFLQINEKHVALWSS